MSTFGVNLAIALGKNGMSQSELAERLFSSGQSNAHMSSKKSTVNKWIKGNAIPKDKTIAKVATILGVEQELLETEKPLIFGLGLGLTRNQIDDFIGNPNDSIYLHSYINSDQNYQQLHQLCGIYHSYLPSWVKRGMINCRVLEIYYERDSFYFSDRHKSYEEISDAVYSGHVLRVGNMLHLIGEEVNGLKVDGSQKKDELMFASLRIPVNENVNQLRGICLGSNPFDDGRMGPTAAAYCAIRVSDTYFDDKPERHFPKKSYVKYDDESIAKPVSLLRKTPLTWFDPSEEWGYEKE